MGCANEKECKKQVQAHSCGIFSIKCDGLNSNPNNKAGSPEKFTQYKDARDHYLNNSIRSELDDQTSFFFDKKTGTICLERKSQFEKIQSYDEGFHIGQYLQMEGETDEIEERRTKSFNPEEKWRKKDEEYKQQLCQDEYAAKQDQLKSDFNQEYMKENYKKNKKKFNEKLRLGPSQQIRWQSWKAKLLNEKEFQEFFKFKVNNIYEFLLCPFMVKNQDSFYENNMYLIVKDITRTFPEMKYFEEMGQQQLKRTLLATSNLFRQVGYCQGMNFIMGMLLLVSGADESSVFDSFISLSFRPEFMLVGLFETGFPLLRFLEFVFEDIFKNRLPKLHEHFKEQEIINTAWITKWLMTLYLYSFPLSKSIRIMDYMISSDVFALIYVAVQILVTLEDQLLKMDGIEVVTFFSRRTSVSEESNTEEANLPSLDQIDIEEIIQNAPKLSLSNKQIRKLAQECQVYIAEEYSILVNKVNKNEKDHELFMQNYALEVSNITFFIHYYTLKNKTEEKSMYHNKIMGKFMNMEIIDINNQKKSNHNNSHHPQQQQLK